MEAEADKAVDWALDWPKGFNKRLCRHVAQYGANQLQPLATELECHARLLELQWHVLLVRAAHKVLGAPKAPDWDTWELGLLRRIWDALKGSGYSKARRYKIIATWLPGRSHDGVKQAFAKYIKPSVSANKDSTVALRDGFPQTVIGTLMAWPGVQKHHQAYLHLSAQQVAEYLLHQAPELLMTAPGSEAAAGSNNSSLKRKRGADPVQENLGRQQQQTEQIAANTHSSAGAAAAGDTTDSVWLPLGRYSSGLSSSSSMAPSGGVTPRTPAATVQGLATLQQLLSQTPNPALTVLTGRESYSSCSSTGADGLDSSRSTGTAVTTSGLSFNSLVDQFSASQHCQTVPQQQEGAPTRRKRSRLSQSTTVQQSMQQGSAAADSGANSETVPGHGLVAYDMLEHEAAWSQPWVLEPVLGTSNVENSNVSTTAAAAAAETAAGPRLLKPASWTSLDSTAAGGLTGDQLTAVCSWSNTWYVAAQQLQAAAATACGPAPARCAATGYQAWVPGSTVAAPGSQQSLLSNSSQQQGSLDNLVRAAVTSSSGEVAARSEGARAAAACATIAVQLPAHASSGWYSSPQVQQDGQQAQPLASMGFEAETAATVLPDCQQAAAAESPAFGAHHFREEIIDSLLATYEVWIEQQQGGQMAELVPSHQGSASASPVASTDDTIGLAGLTELLEADAESDDMVGDAAEHEWQGGLLVEDSNLVLISNKLWEFDMPTLDNELGLVHWLDSKLVSDDLQL